MKETKTYIVTVPIRGSATFLVDAKSKAEAIRFGRDGRREGIDMKIVDEFWGSAEATEDRKEISK